MKRFLLFFVCVALVSYHSVQGDDSDKKEDTEEDDSGRRQFPGGYALGAAGSQAQANGPGAVYRPTLPRPTAKPVLSGCYSCVDCPDVSKLPTPSFCTAYRDPRCVVYQEKYNHRRLPVYVRGCVSERGDCEELKKTHGSQSNVKMLSCIECVGDKCNTSGVARSLPDLTAALFFVVLAPILTKYTLS